MIYFQDKLFLKEITNLFSYCEYLLSLSSHVVEHSRSWYQRNLNISSIVGKYQDCVLPAFSHTKMFIISCVPVPGTYHYLPRTGKVILTFLE